MRTLFIRIISLYFELVSFLVNSQLFQYDFCTVFANINTVKSPSVCLGAATSNVSTSGGVFSFSSKFSFWYNNVRLKSWFIK